MDICWRTMEPHACERIDDTMYPKAAAGGSTGRRYREKVGLPGVACTIPGGVDSASNAKPFSSYKKSKFVLVAARSVLESSPLARVATSHDGGRFSTRGLGVDVRNGA